METKKSSFGKSLISKRRFVVIAIVLCSMLFVALPATTIAAEEDDFVLGIYGNANEDDTIDMRDLTYVKLIFFGERPETELADAKYDDEINPLDFVQIKLILVGKEKVLTIVDSADKIVTLNKPIERIIADSGYVGQFARTLNLQDRVVGVSTYMATMPVYQVFFPELSKLPSVGGYMAGYIEPDFETIFELNPDALFVISGHNPELDEKLEAAGIPLVCFDLYKPNTLIEEVEKLGYLFNREEEAEQYISFYEDCMSTITEKTESLPEEEKPRVYFEMQDYLTVNESNAVGQMITIAGGENICNISCEYYGYPGYLQVDPEWVMVRDPQVIIIKDAHEMGYDIDDPSGVIAARAAVLSRPELDHVSATKNETVYVISSTVMIGPYCFVGDAYMAKWFHPTLFADLDPQAMHQEYLTRFQGLDYDLDDHGVFVYPKEPAS